MEYSLHYLNQIAHLKNLSLSEIVNQLNLIGFEVDEIFYEKSNLNSFLDSIRIFIKIPANREDLLNETFLLQDLSNLLTFELNETWEKIKKNYVGLLKTKYTKNIHYQLDPIVSHVSDVFVYNIEIKKIQNDFSPIWIQNKLKNSNLPITNTSEDVLNLIAFEWGQSFEFLKIDPQTSFSLKRITKTNPFGTKQNEKFQDLKEGTIILVNSQNEILTCLGSLTFDSSIGEKKKVTLNAIFYDIHKNPLQINPLEQSFSLRFLRKTFLQNFKFSFQRLLSILELSYGIEIEDMKISSTFPSSLSIESTKILKLQKKSAKNFLNIDHYDLAVFKKTGLKLIENTPKEFFFKIPSSRNDLAREIDLIEEYSRFIGYNNFSILLPEKTTKWKANENKTFIKDYFIENGFNEVITNPIREGNQPDSTITIINPLRMEFSSLRTELLSDLIQCYMMNSRLMLETKSIFEMGRVFTNQNSFGIYENEKVAGIFRLKMESVRKEMNWIRAQAIMERFFSYFDSDSFQIQKELHLSPPDSFHSRRCIKYRGKKRILGLFGELNPKFKINKNEQTFAFEFNLEAFEERKKESNVKQIKEVSKYPMVVKDVSLRMNFNSPNDISKTIVESCKSIHLSHFEIFDIYMGDPNLNLNEVIIGLRLSFQSQIKTLTNQELEMEIAQIQENILSIGKIKEKEKEKKE